MRESDAVITLPDTPATRLALRTARHLARTKYDQVANCRSCEDSVKNLYKNVADHFDKLLTSIGEV